MGAYHRVASRHNARDEFVDKGILGAPQRGEVEPGDCKELGRVNTAAVRRIEQQRAAAFRRLDHLERRIEIVVQLQVTPSGFRRF